MLGWNPGDDRELFTMDELIEAFSLDKVQKAGAKFNPEKAKWYNKEYLRRKSVEELSNLFVPILESHGIQVVDCPKCALTAGASFAGAGIDFANHIVTREYVEKVVALVKERATFVADFWTVAWYLFVQPEVSFVQKDVDKFWKSENVEMATAAAEHVLSGSFPMTKEAIEEALEGFIKGNEWPMGKVMNCLRLILAGSASGLGIADILSFIGRAELSARLSYAKENLG